VNKIIVICNDFAVMIFPGLLQAIAFAMMMLSTRHYESLAAKQSGHNGRCNTPANNDVETLYATSPGVVYGMLRAMPSRVAHG
jgi:hypothetical protein